MLNLVPIEHAPMTEVCARVAYRLIEMDFRRFPHEYRTSPPLAIHNYAFTLSRNGFPNLDLWLVAYAFHIANGIRASVVRDEMIWRARTGASLRHCVHWTYKAGRRDDPRVTNRGVISPLPVQRGLSEL